ncbi:hypothetical protein CXB51_001436 [Gossypium anomalum]|uniref:Reverse transcriptase domain-containing protein n=1 Tax=Gossypium anomalum TaxID=47600 RepID=A0A8J5ZRT1_9ROSI|nr:hypothetical protein CXB51_001436 [Gossypium anomalum]
MGYVTSGVFLFQGKFPAYSCDETRALISVVSNDEVLWNGTLTDAFQLSRGTRQGDSLSPYLFVLCMERLEHLIEEATVNGSWKPLFLSRRRSALSHFFFANDLMLFCEASSDQAIVEDCCRPLDSGGLGLRKLCDQNKIFLMKLGYHLLVNTESLWVWILRKKYNVQGALPNSISRRNCSFIWKSLSPVWPEVVGNVFWLIGDGRMMNFWNDVWDRDRLTNLVPHLLFNRSQRSYPLTLYGKIAWLGNGWKDGFLSSATYKNLFSQVSDGVAI